MSKRVTFVVVVAQLMMAAKRVLHEALLFP